MNYPIDYGYLYDPKVTEREYRGHKLIRERTYLLWEIKALDGSDAPLALSSRFTTFNLAQEFIDKYLDEDNDYRNRTHNRR